MVYERIGESFGFAYLAVCKSSNPNRSVKMMERINKVINWNNIEALLREY